MGIESELVTDDVQYCIDLGLVRKTKLGIVISNDIYKEVLPRELTESLQNRFLTRFRPEWINGDETIDTRKLMTMFQKFWRENSEIWKPTIAGYLEAAPHLVFQGFLQRVANGQGLVGREYGLGRERADLYLRWKSPSADQRIVFELKMRTERDNTEARYEKILSDGLKQTAGYAEKCEADDLHLIIFDRREDISWDDKIYTETHNFNGREITVWGM